MRKMMVLMLACLLGLTLSLPASVAVDHITFTTVPQMIESGAISGTITIQTRNVDGTSIQIGETGDLLLMTSSLTGEFSSSATNWLSSNTLTMASTSANRSFYYRDSTAGDYLITAALTGRTSGLNWETAQAIVVTPEPTTSMLCLGSLLSLLRRRSRIV
jgi:hypothetical protein